MTVHLALRGDVVVMTLDRPAALNALNAEMIAAIGRAIDQATQMAPRALVVTGAGGKAFCAGADIKELMEAPQGSHSATARAGQDAFKKLDTLRFPSMATISGVALGGGLELAMACTFRIATPKSRFGLPEVKLGLIPGFGGTQRLPRLVGTARALELIASGRVMAADEAERIGLVHQVREMEDPVQAGLEFLAGFGDSYPAALVLAMSAVNRALVLPLDEGLRAEAELFAAAAVTSDAGEGMRAFLEKRKPAFAGH